MNPLITYNYEYTSQGKKYKGEVTNYDWLLSALNIIRELGGIIYGTGTSIEVVDSGDPFSEYLNNKPSWSAYVDVEDCETWKILASVLSQI